MGLRQFSILALLGPFLGPHGCLKSYIGSSGDPVDPSGVPNGPRLTEHDPLLCILLWPGIGSFLALRAPKRARFGPNCPFLAPKGAFLGAQKRPNTRQK